MTAVLGWGGRSERPKKTGGTRKAEHFLDILGGSRSPAQHLKVETGQEPWHPREAKTGAEYVEMEKVQRRGRFWGCGGYLGG